MNKRKAKKASRKVRIPYADEMNLLTLNAEEYKQAMRDFNNYMQKYCRYKHYRDKYKPAGEYHFPVGESVRKMTENALKTARCYPCNIQIASQSVEQLKEQYSEQFGKEI